MGTQKRRFLGGDTKSLRYKAALSHLDAKAGEVRTRGVTTMTLRTDKKALIQESDLRVWASEHGFEIKAADKPNSYYVAKVISAAA